MPYRGTHLPVVHAAAISADLRMNAGASVVALAVVVLVAVVLFVKSGRPHKRLSRLIGLIHRPKRAAQSHDALHQRRAGQGCSDKKIP
jgi:uncharacterized membrane protein